MCACRHSDLAGFAPKMYRMDAAYISLDDFAPEARSSCGPCNLPVSLRREMQDARRRDPGRFTYPIISAWLADQGHPIHPDALRRHFKRGHA